MAMIETDESATWPSDPAETLRILYPRLLALARTLTEEAEARDLVQDVLVETLVRHPGFRDVEYPLGYTRMVLLRLASRRSRRLHDHPVPEVLLSSLEADLPDVAEAIADRLTLRGGLRRLGRRQRACVFLRYEWGLDDREIAGSSDVDLPRSGASLLEAWPRCETESGRGTEAVNECGWR